MKNPIIELRKLNFFYDQGKPNEQHALKDINLEVGRGEYVAFFGPSGCGKSTLLYSIAGIQPPTSGEVLVEERNIMSATQEELALYRQTEVGIIFQNFNLIPTLPVLDNVGMPMAFLGIKRNERNKRAIEALGRLGIEDLARRFPYELSGGQQQRVGIARALVNAPPVILADEPLGNLDSENANKVLEFLRDLNRKDGKTIIMVTHEAWSLRDAEKIFHMKDGMMIQAEARTPAGAPSPVSVPAKMSSARRAGGFAELFLSGYPREQAERFAAFVAALLSGEIDLALFVRKLDAPFNEGGVGLWRQRAEHVGKAMDHALRESEDLAAARAKLAKDPQASIKEETTRIRGWLFEDVSPLSYKDAPVVDALIEKRIRGALGADEFRKLLTAPKKDKGAGLRITRALKAAQKMEVLLPAEA